MRPPFFVSWFLLLNFKSFEKNISPLLQLARSELKKINVIFSFLLSFSLSFFFFFFFFVFLFLRNKHLSYMVHCIWSGLGGWVWICTGCIHHTYWQVYRWNNTYGQLCFEGIEKNLMLVPASCLWKTEQQNIFQDFFFQHLSQSFNWDITSYLRHYKIITILM